MKNLAAEVIASGGGPTGVLLACELRLAGVDVLLLDRHPAPSGMGGALTADVLAQRGVSDLLAWADQLGVRQRRPVELVTLRQDATAVDVEVRTPRGAEWLRAGWLVDCDFPDTRLRDGRVLLAGARSDPVNGLEDAANLGWKLASVVRGHTGAELLDTYRTERATLDGGYRLGTGHPWLGRRVPDLDLTTAAGSTSAFTLLRAARPLLIDFADRPSPLRGLVEGWADRVDLVEALSPGGEAPGALLVRPDGYVAWVPGAGDLGAALAAWFGPCR